MFKTIQEPDFVDTVFTGSELQAVCDFFGARGAGFSHIFIITDTNTHKHCLPQLTTNVPVLAKSTVIELPAGENAKNIYSAQKIWQVLMDHQADRNALLINLGGGVVSDLGGFAASVYKRGIKFINLPTSLMAQVDAAIGGKTALNFDGVKNPLGSFYKPVVTFINPAFIRTLPLREFNSGMAEVFKHALIADKTYWNKLKEIAWPLQENWMEIIKTSAAIKSVIVEDDMHEQGMRKLLNFGHTIGHALETVVNRNQQMMVTHGEAVAAGIICESFISNQQGELSGRELYEITGVIKANFYPVRLKKEDFKEINQLILHDKKNLAGKTAFTLLQEIGKAVYNKEVAPEMIEMSLNFYLETANVFFENN